MPIASSDAFLQSWKDDSPYAWQKKAKRSTLFASKRSSSIGKCDSIFSNSTGISTHTLKINKDKLTSKIGVAPVKNLTASAYASDLIHFPS